MDSQYKSKTNIFIALGLGIQIVAIGSGLHESINALGAVLVIIGCCFYAKGKGYNAAWGLLGLLSILGLIILICMKDLTKEPVRCQPLKTVFKCPSCNNEMEYDGALQAGQKVQCPHCNNTFVIRPTS